MHKALAAQSAASEDMPRFLTCGPCDKENNMNLIPPAKRVDTIRRCLSDHLFGGNPLHRQKPDKPVIAKRTDKTG
jgi:hypothetical protein